MTTAAHTAIGYLIAQAFIHYGVIPQSMASEILAFGMIAANGPDVDGFALWRILRHRTRSPFHKPILWFIFLVPTLIVTFSLGLTLQFTLTILTLLCVLSHFICDSLDFSTGITWLWPYSRKQFHAWRYSFPDPKTFKEGFRQLKKNPTLFIELAISVFSLIVFHRAR